MKNEDLTAGGLMDAGFGGGLAASNVGGGNMILGNQPNAKSTDDRIDALLMATERLAVNMDSFVTQEIIRREEQKNRDLTAPITEDQALEINEAVRVRVYTYLGLTTRKRRMTPEQKRLRKVYGDVHFRELWRAVRKRFKVARYRQIRAVDYDEALRFIADWVPEDEDELRRDAEEDWRDDHPGQDLDEYLGRLPV